MERNCELREAKYVEGVRWRGGANSHASKDPETDEGVHLAFTITITSIAHRTDHWPSLANIIASTVTATHIRPR
jgi:hypothetical protein